MGKSISYTDFFKKENTHRDVRLKWLLHAEGFMYVALWRRQQYQQEADPVVAEHWVKVQIPRARWQIWGRGNVLPLDCGDGSMTVCVYQNWHSKRWILLYVHYTLISTKSDWPETSSLDYSVVRRCKINIPLLHRCVAVTASSVINFSLEIVGQSAPGCLLLLAW